MRNKTTTLTAVAIGITLMPLVAAGATRGNVAPSWSVQVNQVEAGDIKVAPEFKTAIYENLLIELTKTKQFSAVLRGGDRSAQDRPSLLVLKTTVESFQAGSETKRAVTTIAGATKLRVRTQLCTTQGEVVLERVVNGNVRFFGGNLRATHNLARNVAKVVKEEKLPPPGAGVRVTRSHSSFHPTFPNSCFYVFDGQKSAGPKRFADT